MPPHFSTKLGRGRQISINVMEPRRGHYERNHTTSTDQGLLTISIEIKAHRIDPLNELADRWTDLAEKMKTSDCPFPRKDPSSPGLNMEKHPRVP